VKGGEEEGRKGDKAGWTEMELLWDSWEVGFGFGFVGLEEGLGWDWDWDWSLERGVG
jgi:hypothetical protein